MVYTIVVHLYAKAEQECIEKLKAKLVEASTVYSKDKETLSWFVMQDVGDKRSFTIVERYLKESSQKYHLEVSRPPQGFAGLVLMGAQNPYWKTFDPYVNPLLEKPMDLRRLEELDTSVG
jgi:quinol monooxygenase YgiN